MERKFFIVESVRMDRKNNIVRLSGNYSNKKKEKKYLEIKDETFDDKLQALAEMLAKGIIKPGNLNSSVSRFFYAWIRACETVNFNKKKFSKYTRDKKEKVLSELAEELEGHYRMKNLKKSYLVACETDSGNPEFFIKTGKFFPKEQRFSGYRLGKAEDVKKLFDLRYAVTLCDILNKSYSRKFKIVKIEK